MAVVSITVPRSYFFFFNTHTDSLAAEDNQVLISYNLGISVRAADLPKCIQRLKTLYNLWK